MQVTAPIHNMMCCCVFYTKTKHTTDMEQYGVCNIPSGVNCMATPVLTVYIRSINLQSALSCM